MVVQWPGAAEAKWWVLVLELCTAKSNVVRLHAYAYIVTTYICVCVYFYMCVCTYM